AWRQPAAALADTQAVFVRGGERYGEHDELEGSLRATQIPGGVDVNVNLWLNRFERAPAFGRGNTAGVGRRGDFSTGDFSTAGGSGFGSAPQAGSGGMPPGLDNPLIWRLPAQPFPLPEPPRPEMDAGLVPEPRPVWRVVEVAPLQQIRSITNDS